MKALTLNNIIAGLVTTGVVAGSVIVPKVADNAVPGQPLYAVDRAIESVQDFVAFTPEAKINIRLNQLQERAQELKQITNKDQELIKEQLEDIRKDLVSVSEDLKENWDKLSVQQRQEYTNRLREVASNLLSSLDKLPELNQERVQVLRQVRETAEELYHNPDNAVEKPSQRYGYVERREQDYIKTAPKQELTEEIKETLIHMREEEKLARDVYLALYDKWGDRVFKNIANSEQTHMDTLKVLIDKYNLPDPVKGVGEFSDPKLQDLYNQLVAQGSKSLADALKVGATIEDLDIYDLNQGIAQLGANNSDIKEAYDRLRSGSYNHIRAFSSKLKSLGEEYTAQFISQDELDKILGSTNERGRGNGAGPDKHNDSFVPGMGRGRGARINDSNENEDEHDGFGPRRWQDH